MMNEGLLKQAARYMGSPLTDESLPLLKAAWEQMALAAKPMRIVRSVGFKSETDGVWADELFLPGKSILKHLAGCERGYLIAATLGTGMDQNIRMQSLLSVAKGMAVSACASAYIEAYLDESCVELGREYFLTPRFSPGYGDLPLGIQAAFLEFVHSRRIGLYITNMGMMAPEKSVTAIIGITPDERRACQSNCQRCQLKTCPFREEIQ